MKESYLNECPYYLMDYLTYISVVKDRGERTVEAYFIDLRCFLRYLRIMHRDIPADTDFEEIDIKDTPISYVENFTVSQAYLYMSWLKETRHNEAVTRARKTTALREFYSYLFNKAKLIASDPMTELETPAVKHALPKFLTLEESETLLRSVESSFTERDYCIITLFLNCGMRLSELVGINSSDISFDNKTIRLLGKGRKERIVYLNDACIKAINAYLPCRNAMNPENTDAFFLSKRKTRISKRRVQQIVEECIKKADLSNTGVTAHKLRHTAATLMYQYGDVDMLVLKDLLGHVSTSTTEIYTHLSDKNLKEAADSSPLASEEINIKR